jgi:hypothetical protein
MPAPFVPTQQDVERYRALRATNVELNHKIIKTIPPPAYDEIGEAIGMLRDGILVFDSEDMTGVLMDCLLYDWFENGKSVVQRYAETHPPEAGTDEGVVLDAALHAKYRVLVPDSAIPGAGLYCRDILNGGELFLMDIALSHSLGDDEAALATRTLPLGEYWMTGGAGLPIDSNADFTGALRRVSAGGRTIESPSAMTLAIVRACLEAGAAEHVAYKTPSVKAPAAQPKKPHHPRWSKRHRR